MKKRIIAATALIGIAGGVIFAQNTLFKAADNQLSASEAKKIALKTFDGTIVDFDYDKDDLTPHYDFEIKNGTEQVDVEVDAKSGNATITERENYKSNIFTKVENAVDSVKSDSQIALSKATGAVEGNNNSSDEITTPSTETTISKAQAINVASSVASGTVVKAELDNDNHEPATYEIKFRDGRTEYEVKVDAVSGEIVYFETDIDND